MMMIMLRSHSWTFQFRFQLSIERLPFNNLFVLDLKSTDLFEFVCTCELVSLELKLH